MKPKQMMLFAVALGCGLVAMIGAQQILSGNKPAEQEMVKILVAKSDIDPGVLLDKTNVEFKDWPRDNVPEGAIQHKEEIAERALKIRVSPNMPILVPYLGPKGAIGVESMIPKGMNLVTLPVDLTQSHSGLMRPGSYVSVACAIERVGRDGKQAVTIKTVLNRVKVIALNDRLAGTEVATKEGNSGEAKTISFATYPRQAKLLFLAKHVSGGKMQFSMLGESDGSSEDTQDLDEDAFAQRSSDLLGDATEQQKPAPQQTTAAPVGRPSGSSFAEYLKQQPVSPTVAELGARPSRATWVIEVYNGDKKEIHEVELTDNPTPAQVPTLPTIGEQWTTPLMQFFSRRRNPSKVEATEALPAEEIRQELSNDKSAAAEPAAVRQ